MARHRRGHGRPHISVRQSIGAASFRIGGVANRVAVASATRLRGGHAGHQRREGALWCQCRRHRRGHGTPDSEVQERGPRTIAAGAEMVAQTISDYDYAGCGPAPKILFVSPIHIKPGISRSPYVGFAEDAVERSHELSHWYREAAERNGWLFFDASTVSEPSDLDKLHMDAESHARLADAVANVLLSDAAE